MPSMDNLLRLSELYHVHMEEFLIKTGYVLSYNVEKKTKKNLEKRLKAYYYKLAT